MESKTKPIAFVKSPAKSSHTRKGTGFSLSEIKEARKTVSQLKELNIKIDYLRKSAYPENIKLLKELEIPKKKATKREPFVKKEKRKAAFKPKTEKPVVKRKKVTKGVPKKPEVKAKAKPVKKEKAKTVREEKVKVEPTGIPLTELSGLGAATAKKFVELGVNNVEELCNEDPEELAPLIKGVSVDRLKKWVEEGKSLIK